MIWANLAEITQSKRLFEKFGGGVRFGGESCNWYCRSVLFRFTVLRRKIGYGGGFTVSNRRFLFSAFGSLAVPPWLGLRLAGSRSAWLTLSLRWTVDRLRSLLDIVRAFRSRAARRRQGRWF